ncbi:zinc-binding protein A33-like isoform X2 [Electrophorus electricus]|uniref:zinc-binding protein A33-like isoform X2 n=1 Tax=Electrophorus electricus TaxID=8005 RepID=UPI000F0A8900|nr:zinc-binding protein A33-like isoform X2 [Electrophorus electricus]
MACEISALEELHTELTCPICLDMFNEPVILECGHHFCRSCIRQCWEAKSEESTSCPKCRKRCTRSLRPNSLLCNVVQSVRRARAKDARPKERAPKMPPDNAKLSSVTASHAEPVSNLCTDHEEKLKLFCEDDQVAICLVCGLSRDHKTHNVIPINEAYDNYKETLSSLVQRVEEQMGTASQYQVLTNDMILQMKDQADVLEIQISSEFQKIRDFLSRQEQEMKMRLHQAKEKRLKVLGDTLTHTTSQLSQLELSKHLIQTKLSQVENPEILTDIKDFIESVQCEFKPPEHVFVTLPAGEFVGPLQYRVWRNMSSILQPGVEAITFDPLTAYPRLWVSCCGRSVCVGKIQTGLPNNPERFTLYNIVLGSQAISEGRHYWEVGGKTAWGLGVASASVNRKEELSLCPEEGFWTLVLSENGYEACNSTVESPLELAHPPRRVGVYLDYGRGHVSFYDAEDMTHLYTFVNAHFTEPVYPYFNPWPIMNGRNREPLTIHMPQL